MKQDPFALGEPLRAAVTALIVPIQTTREIDESAFEQLHDIARQLVYACKGRPEVPKGLLLELVATYSILRAEAPHFGDQRVRLEEMADAVNRCFGMILADELPEDRRPGVPRII